MTDHKCSKCGAAMLRARPTWTVLANGWKLVESICDRCWHDHDGRLGALLRKEYAEACALAIGKHGETIGKVRA